MDIKLYPTKLKGRIIAIPSKSQAHRILILSAFADRCTEIRCPETNRDIEATAQCLRALGAKIQRTKEGYTVTPVTEIPREAVLPCAESGSTLRFMLPVVAALGVNGLFQMEGRLPQRPMDPLIHALTEKGCSITRPDGNTLSCSGKLSSGSYTIDGSLSSQYITGLLLAMALISGPCHLTITGKIESKPYIDMTLDALDTFGVGTADLRIDSSIPLHSPGSICVEGDWSNAAFFLAANALGNPVETDGLRSDSTQGDRAVIPMLRKLREHACIDAADIPDLVPILAVAAGAKSGAVFENIARLRLKESDRVASVAAMLEALGCKTQAQENTLTVFAGVYHSCTIDACGDHRIAMAAAIAATVADGPVTIRGAQCVEKSYPTFWQEYQRLGGQYEQYIR